MQVLEPNSKSKWSKGRDISLSKFGLLSFALVLPFVFVIGLVIVHQYEAIQAVKKSQKHLQAIHYLESMYQEAEHLRDISLIAAFGNDPQAKEIYDLHHAQLKESLVRFRQQALPLKHVFFLKSSLESMSMRLSEINTSYGLESWAGAVQNSYSEHQKLVSSIRKLQVRLAEHAGMFTDQDQVASQLLFFYLEEMNELFVALGELRAYGSFVKYRGYLASDIAQLLDRVYEYLTTVQTPLILQAQNIFSLSDHQNASELSSIYQFAGIANSVYLLSEHIIEEPELSGDWAYFFGLVRDEIDSIYQGNQNVLGFLQQRYQNRLSLYYQRQAYCLVGLLALIVLVVCIYIIDFKETQERVLAKREKQAAEATAMARAKFLATMSHEIRTPINGILGMANLFEGTQLTEEQLRYLRAIKTSGNALLSVINDILDYSKIESGKLHVETLRFDLPHLIDECVSLFQFTAQQKHLELVMQIQADVPCEVVSDPTRVRQVLLNMLSNAFKFTESGRIDVSVSIETHNQEQFVRIAVKDTGIGIAPDQVARLFEAFEQADSSVTRKFGGTGLGLAISKQLVELMGGSIGATGKLGEGAEFWFDFPVPENGYVPFKNWISREVERVDVALAINQSAYRNELKDLLSIWGFDCREINNLSLLKEWSFEHVSKPGIVVCDAQGQAWIGEIPKPSRESVKVLLFGEIRENQRSMKSDGPTILSPVSISQVKSVLGKLKHGIPQDAQPGESGQNEVKTIQQDNKGEELSGREVDEAEDAQQFDLKNKNVLIAEDNTINQLVIKGTLKKLNAVAHIVENGKQALDTYCADPTQFDLILMDWEMPVMDGVTSCKSIRDWERLNDVQAVPIVVLTAHALEEYERQAYEAGMQGFLTKPINVEKLGSLLAAQLRV